MANRELSTLSIDEIKQTNFAASGYPDDGSAQSLKDVADNASSFDGRIEAIEDLIPSTSSADNPLADQGFVNSSINAMAARPLTYDGVNPFPTKTSLDNAAVFYNKGVEVTPAENDYVTVLSDETQNGGQVRYGYDGTQWVFRYKINDAPFTEEQNASINSGSTAEDIDNLREHLSDENNPHNVTKSQVGLDNVDNTSDMDKPVSTSTVLFLNSSMVVPDYSNIGSANLISTPTGSWRADRSGFIRVSITHNVTSAAIIERGVFINDMSSFYRDRIMATPMPTGLYVWAETIPIGYGDVVRFVTGTDALTGNQYSCNFIPAKRVVTQP